MSPRWFLAGSLGFTLLFNVAWAWGTGWLSVIAAGACTLIVPIGLHLWRQVPAPSWWQRAARDLVLAGVCLAALVTSFSHSVSVLLLARWTELSAWAVTGGMELLVALSTMAVLAGQTTRQGSKHAADTPAGQPSDRAVQAEPDTADTPAPAEPDRPAPDSPARLSAVPTPLPDDPVQDLRQWAAQLGRIPSGNEVRKRYGCGYERATRLLAGLDDEAAG